MKSVLKYESQFIMINKEYYVNILHIKILNITILNFFAKVEKAGGLLGVTSRGLCILIILIIIIILLFIIIIILAALWPRKPYREPPIICDTPPCLRAAAQVISNKQTKC